MFKAFYKPMDKNNLYLLKGKDCSENIENITIDSNGRYKILFKGKGKEYVYSATNVQIKAPLEQISPKNNIVDADNKI